MALRVVGRHKSSITLDLNTATVLDLKEVIARESGLALGGLKLLAGGKHLKDDCSILARCGITPGKTIMVLRQDLSGEEQAEAGLSRRTEEVAQAASLLSARAARDNVEGGRGNPWGTWGQAGRGGGRGRGGFGGNRHGGLPEMELTNQDGEAMYIPADDSAALMEGIMLHRKGLACVARMGTAKAAAATSAAESLRALEGKATRLSPAAHTAAASLSPEAPATTDSSALGSGKEDFPHGSNAEVVNCPAVGEQSGREEQKENAPHDDGDTTQGGEDAGTRDNLQIGGDAREPSTTPPNGGVTKGESSVGSGQTSAGGAVAPGEGGASGGADGKRKEENVAKGKGKLKSGKPLTIRANNHGRAPSASEKRLAQREALGLLLRADKAFQRCDPKYLELVDNYAYLCLDIVWLLFLMKDMSNLDLASRMLRSVDTGFRKAHGPGLHRLTALKGDHCAEKLLYVRLHLLQGVVAFLQGDSGTASGLLIRASEEAKALKPSPALAARLMQKWRALKFEPLTSKVALQALRAGRNNLDAAWQYLENLRQRQETVRKEREQRAEQRRAGLTADLKGFVDMTFVTQLVDGGFPRAMAISALREHNNDIGAALASLTSGHGNSGDHSEALAILQSLGVPPEAAQSILERVGTLTDALRELGIDAPGGIVSAASAISDALSLSSPGSGSTQSGDADAGVAQSVQAAVRQLTASDEWRAWVDANSVSKMTPEETRLYNELAADRESQEEEGYLDVTLEDEADAADMYLHLCRGNIPVAFDLEKVRAGIAAAAAETAD